MGVSTLKPKIVIGFLIYGVIVGLLSAWWRHFSDNIFLLNIPGVLLGHEVYELSIYWLGDPGSPQAHYTIPGILRIPQVYIPVSMLFWGMIGLAIQMAINRFKE